MGYLFGIAPEKPGNIAGFAIIASIMMIAVLAFWAPRGDVVPLRELYTLFGVVITIALGYVFGKGQGG